MPDSFNPQNTPKLLLTPFTKGFRWRPQSLARELIINKGLLKARIFGYFKSSTYLTETNIFNELTMSI